MSAHATEAPRSRDAASGTVTAAAVATRRPGVRTVYTWELRKLAAQKRTYGGGVAAARRPAVTVPGCRRRSTGGSSC